jgi:hypothetical protein
VRHWCVLLTLAIAPVAAQTPDPRMSFFVTSEGALYGAALGGLKGADNHCETLAVAAGAGGKTWRAYLSTAGWNRGERVDARDRIGTGPWFNAKGIEIAASVDALHGAGNNIDRTTALTEKGEVVNGLDDSPNLHDILTGSNADGRLQRPQRIPPPRGAPRGTPASPPPPNMTCNDWTGPNDTPRSFVIPHTGGDPAKQLQNIVMDSAMVGHHDRQGEGRDGASWNSAHATRGCLPRQLAETGGAGLLYCFAVD